MTDDREVSFDRDDLAPGDTRSLELETSALRAVRVDSPDDRLFEPAYAALWNEFGAAGELEQADVLAARLLRSQSNSMMRYELAVVLQDDQIVAVRDHQAYRPDARRGEVIVHLSHAWVSPRYRRSGLAGWLRAFPVQTARLLLSTGVHDAADLTLVAEMEHPDPRCPERAIRLSAYEKAGFLKVDRAAFEYLQPDFRPPAEIDSGGGPLPLPFALIVRRVGRERETKMTGDELRRFVDALYQMYARDFRAGDMSPIWRHLAEHGPSAESPVPLLPPTAGCR